MWENVQKAAFLDLKKAITTAPVLILLDKNSPFCVECDTSDYTLGAVLSQEREGKWHPVAFLSKAMTNTKHNYEIYDKELLAVMTSLGEWRHLVICRGIPLASEAKPLPLPPNTPTPVEGRGILRV